MAKKTAASGLFKKKKLPGFAENSVDDSPIIIDGGGSTRVKQKGQRPGFSDNQRTVSFPKLKNIHVRAITFGGGDHINDAFVPQPITIFTGNGSSMTVTPVAAGGGVPAHTDVTYQTNHVREEQDPVTLEFTYLGDDDGDIRRIDIDGGTINIPATVTHTIIRLKLK